MVTAPVSCESRLAPWTTDLNDFFHFRVELALWTHYVASELSPEMLSDLPPSTDNHKTSSGTNGVTTTGTTAADTTTTQLEPSSDNESNLEPAQAAPTNGEYGALSLHPCTTASGPLFRAPGLTNLPFAGVIDSLDESTRSEDSMEKPNTPIVANDETNDSDSQSSAKR